MIRVTIWNEFLHERQDELPMKHYPEGIHKYLGDVLGREADIQVTGVTMDMPDHGITEALLCETDVLIWWGHRDHEGVSDQIVALVCRHIQMGMGFLPLHSAHHSKVFKQLMGTSCNLRWMHGDREKLIPVMPQHPIAEGIAGPIELPEEEMYGEFFDIPKPDDVIFAGWFESGEVFRSGCTFTRGMGHIFYFQPGHEEYPIYHNKDIQQIIINAVRWLKPVVRLKEPYDCTAVQHLS